MHIVFLTKRRYMGKDVIDDRYGRFYEIPEQMALRGHRVTGVCLDYHWRDGHYQHSTTTPSGVNWNAYKLWPFPPYGWLRYTGHLRYILRTQKPDVIIGCSDAVQIALADHMASRHQLPLVIDLYDQFETYGLTKLPGLTTRYRKALGNATAVTCVTKRLRDWVSAIRQDQESIFILSNAISPDLFHPRNKQECRQRLALPDNCTLIGTAGALTKQRDIDTLYTAFLGLAASNENIHLVVAGRRDQPPPAHPRIHDLGEVPHEAVPIMFSSLDLGIVCTTDDRFAYFCHPQKLLEMQACRLPVITSDVLERNSDEQSLCYETGNAESLTQCILEATSTGLDNDVLDTTPTWAIQAEKLERLILQATNQ